MLRDGKSPITTPQQWRLMPPGVFWLACAVLAIAGALSWWHHLASRPEPAQTSPKASETPLLLAPMIGGLADCLFPEQAKASFSNLDVLAPCLGPTASAAPWVESSLAPLFGDRLRSPPYELGVTLQVPLLRYFERGPGGWKLDVGAIARTAETVRASPRRVVLYFFSNHFELPTPLEAELFEDVRNRAVSQRGPMPLDTYYGTKIYPWSVASTDNGITQFRETAMVALADALCRLPDADRQKIAGLTVLGELHQFFPGFESEAGFRKPYEVSDYSEASQRAFQRHLGRVFSSVRAMNVALGTNHRSFQDVKPPGMLSPGPAAGVAVPLDGTSSGRIPVSGWVHDGRRPGSEPLWVRVSLNGRNIARVRADLGRQDVLFARPALQTAQVGWRYDVDYRKLVDGAYRLEAFAELPEGGLLALGERRFTLSGQPAFGVQRWRVTRDHRSVARVPGVSGYWDLPEPNAIFSHSPLAAHWQAFRAEQVAAYFDHFANVLRRTCLRDRAIYTHQILPQVNPDWDSEKFAASALLKPRDGVSLGVSLYGEAAHGRSFFEWLAASGHTAYGVTEFHPLQGMDHAELSRTLLRHRSHGATFVSFFMDRDVAGVPPPSLKNPFSFNPAVTEFGSSTLFQSLKTVVNQAASE